MPRVNPASVAKLATTFAALDLLGPTFAWSTPVYFDGPVRDGVLQGNLVIKGQGDPKLVIERLWLLLRRVQSMGVRSITGDIVLDRSAFAVGPRDPAAFDGEPLRPYNASPDALLINFKTVTVTVTPEGGQARVRVEAAAGRRAMAGLGAHRQRWRNAATGSPRCRRFPQPRRRCAFGGRFSRRLRRAGLAAGLAGAGGLHAARDRGDLARHGRPPGGQVARRARCRGAEAGLRVRLAARSRR
jgi:D-alanyl-D-alanine carboxypeptidase